MELNAPLTFVYVRRGPAGILGTPVFERRLTRKMAEARRVIEHALRGAARVGVEAEGEILEGSPRKRIVEFAKRSERTADRHRFETPQARAQCLARDCACLPDSLYSSHAARSARIDSGVS